MKKRNRSISISLIILLLFMQSLLIGCSNNEISDLEQNEYDQEVDVKIVLSETASEISPLIYGEFLEHITGVVYYSIWSEKVEDRKFYYGIEEVGLSPWLLSEGANIETEKEDTLSDTDYAVRLYSGGIKQDIYTVVGTYTGYLYAKGHANITVKLENDLVAIRVDSDEWKKYDYTIDSDSNSKKKFGIYSDAEVLIDSVSLMPDNNFHGMNLATLDALKELKGTIYRWPGGNFVSGYDWKDGIGNRDLRPSKRNLAWFPDNGNIENDIKRLKNNGFYSCIEPNDMGIDEFLLMCEYIETIPYLVVNTGLGSVEDAADQVEYCNGSLSTEYGRIRFENGRRDPYNVKYWSVGNEMQGDWQLGHTNVIEYSTKHNEFADAMKAVDPSILLTACGDNVSSWSDSMLTNCSGNIDFLGEHLYATSSDDVFEHILFMKNNIEWRIDEHRKLLEKHPDQKNIKIAFDEFAYLWDGYADLKDALGIATALNIFIRNSDVVGMANYSDAVFNMSVRHGPGAINVLDDKIVFQPVGLVLKNFANYFEKIPVTLFASYDKSLRLEIAAALSQDGKTLTLSVVNPSTKTVKISPNIAGNILKKIEVSGPDHAVYNTFDEVKVTETITENLKSYLVNPLSVNIFVIELN